MFYICKRIKGKFYGILNIGDFMIKRIKKYICYLLIISSILLLSGCSNKSQDELLVSKLSSEMKYFDSTISTMLNKANGLTFENYKVVAQKIENDSQGSGGGAKESKQKESSGQEQGGESSSSERFI